MKLENWKAWVEDLTFIRQVLSEQYGEMMKEANVANDTAVRCEAFPNNPFDGAAKAARKEQADYHQSASLCDHAHAQAGRLLAAAQREVLANEETKRMGQGS